MKPDYVKYIHYSVEDNGKDPKFENGDHERTSK